jgi:hypothetical protein
MSFCTKHAREAAGWFVLQSIEFTSMNDGLKRSPIGRVRFSGLSAEGRLENCRAKSRNGAIGFQL